MISRFLNPQGGPVQQGSDPFSLLQREVNRGHVGGRTHEEYWIPAEDLEEFNQNIVGKIEVIAEFRGD